MGLAELRLPNEPSVKPFTSNPGAVMRPMLLKVSSLLGSKNQKACIENTPEKQPKSHHP